MEIIYLVWLVILSSVVFGQSSTIKSLGRSIEQVRAWANAVVAQSRAGAPEAAAPAAAAVGASPAPVTGAAPAAAKPAAFSAARGEEHGGRWLAVVGVLAVVAGAAFGVQFAIENGWLTEGLRMVLGAALGLGLVFGGNALRTRLGWFGDAILGLGLGLLYLTAYSGYVFFDFYGYGFALFATVSVSALSALLAVSSKVEAPAALGATGAFVAALALPMTASPAAVAFAFAVAAVSMVAAVGSGWRATQTISFVGAAIVFFQYLGQTYDMANDFWFAEVFALLLLALFTFAGYGITALRHREPSSFDVGVSAFAALVFGGIAVGLAADYSTDYAGFLPLFLSFAYAAGAAWGYRAKASGMANAASLALAATFLAVAISLQLDGAWVPVLWAAEAAALAFLVRGTASRALALLSAGVAFCAFVAASDVGLTYPATPVLNARFAAFLAVLVAGWALAAAARGVWRRVGSDGWKSGFAVVAVASHLLALGVLAGEVNLAYEQRIEAASQPFVDGGASETVQAYQRARLEVDRLESSRSVATAIVWGLYGALILVIGFAVSSAPSRYAGVGTLLLVAADVFLIVWDLGTGYRVIASLSVGALALGGAYLFARYRSRLSEAPKQPAA